MILIVIFMLIMQVNVPIVTAQDAGLAVSYRTATLADGNDIVNLLNDPVLKDQGYWCNTGAVSEADLATLWARDILIHGADNYFVSISEGDDGKIKGLIQGWIFDEDKFKFRAVVWNAKTIPEDEWILHVHSHVLEVLRQLEERGVTHVYGEGVENTWINSYMAFVNGREYNETVYNNISIDYLQSVVVQRGTILPYSERNITVIPGNPIPKEATQIDENTWVIRR